MPPNNQSLSLAPESGVKAHHQSTATRAAGQFQDHRFFNWLPGGKAFKAAYATAVPSSWEGRCPFDHYLRQLKVDMHVSAIDLHRIPRQGPLIVVANHPYGGLDGLMLGAIIARARTDFKLLANRYLSAIAAVGDAIIPVDVLGGRTAMRFNMRSLRQAVDWLRSGGCLGVFPAGEVSRFRPVELSVVDQTWGSHVAALLRRSKASVVPVYFPGRNSTLFTMASMLHPFLGSIQNPVAVLSIDSCVYGCSIAAVSFDPGDRLFPLSGRNAG